KGARRLAGAVLDLLVRVAHGAGEVVIPGVVEEGHHRPDRQRLGVDRLGGIAGIVFNADIERRVVVIVLDPGAVDALEPEYILLDPEVGADRPTAGPEGAV